MVSSWHQLKRNPEVKATAVVVNKSNKNTVPQLIDPTYKVESKKYKRKVPIQKIVEATLALLNEGWSFDYALNTSCGATPPTTIRRLVRGAPEICKFFDSKLDYNPNFTKATMQSIASAQGLSGLEPMMAPLLNQERVEQIVKLIDEGYSLAYAYTQLFGPCLKNELIQNARLYPEIVKAIARKQDRQNHANRKVKKDPIQIIESNLDASNTIDPSELRHLLGRKWKLVAIEKN